MIKGRISTFRPKYGSKLAMRIGETTEEGGRFPYLPPSAPTTTFYPWTILYHLCIPTNKQSKSLLRQSYLHNHNARETVCYSLILTKKTEKNAQITMSFGCRPWRIVIEAHVYSWASMSTPQGGGSSPACLRHLLRNKKHSQALSYRAHVQYLLGRQPCAHPQLRT